MQLGPGLALAGAGRSIRDYESQITAGGFRILGLVACSLEAMRCSERA